MADSNGGFEKLTREIAEQNAEALAALADLIPEIDYSAEYILAEKKPDGRDMSTKWQHSYILKEDGEIVGFVMGFVRAAENNDQYPVESLYMSELAIHPSYQGKGYAKKLTSHYLKQGIEAGMNSFTLQTNAADWNEPVRKLYRSFGFREDGFKWYGNRKDVVMRVDNKAIQANGT